MQALEFVADGMCSRVLDVGIGSGAFFTEILRKTGNHAFVCGIDLSRGMVRKARQRPSTRPNAPHLMEADAIKLPFADESFDVVVSSYVLDLMPVDAIFCALTEFCRVLKPGGCTILVNLTKLDPDRTTWYERCYMALPAIAQAYVLGGCRPVCLEDVLEAAGFVNGRRIVVHQALSSEILFGEKPRLNDESWRAA